MSLADEPRVGEVIRFKTVTKREEGAFINYKTPKNKESFGLLLGMVGTVEDLPDNKDLIKRMNSLGWVSRRQLVDTYGKVEGERMFKKVIV